MAAYRKFVCCFILLVSLPYFISGDTCLGPQVTSSQYTTTDSIASIDTVFIVQFNLTCRNGLKNLNLYADINGRTLPATRTDIPNRYQISISDEDKNLPSGSYDIRLFDEEGYATLRKAQRSGENTDIKPLERISVKHPGVWKGTFVNSEFVAAIVSILVWYFAYSAKSKLQASH